MPKAPAMGGANVDKPGMNFDNIKVAAPDLAKLNSLLRTQVSGEIEILHISVKMRWP